MADATLGASWIPGAGAQFLDGTSGEVITIGNACYLDSATNTFKKAQCDGTLAESQVVGFATATVISGAHLRVQTQGQATVSGASLTKGVLYYLSATAGSPTGVVADIVSTNYITHTFGALTSTTVDIKIHVLGVVL